MHVGPSTLPSPFHDEAVSPVIAVILMVAITVVLAATVYVWTEGFSGNKDQGVTAAFDVTGCNVSDGDDTAETLTLKLISAPRAIDPSDLRAEVYQENDGSNAGTWSIPSGDWSVGSSKTFTDDSATDDLESGTLYEISIVYVPSQDIIASPEVTC